MPDARDAAIDELVHAFEELARAWDRSSEPWAEKWRGVAKDRLRQLLELGRATEPKRRKRIRGKRA